MNFFKRKSISINRSGRRKTRTNDQWLDSSNNTQNGETEQNEEKLHENVSIILSDIIQSYHNSGGINTTTNFGDSNNNVSVNQIVNQDKWRRKSVADILINQNKNQFLSVGYIFKEKEREKENQKSVKLHRNSIFNSRKNEHYILNWLSPEQSSQINATETKVNDDSSRDNTSKSLRELNKSRKSTKFKNVQTSRFEQDLPPEEFVKSEDKSDIRNIFEISNDKIRNFNNISHKLKQSIIDVTFYDGFHKNTKPESSAKEQTPSDSKARWSYINMYETTYRKWNLKEDRVYDSLSNEESDEEEKDKYKWKQYIAPETNLKIAIDCFIFMNTCSVMLFAPLSWVKFQGSFNHALVVLNIFWDFINIFDVLLSFFTSFSNDDWKNETNAKTIAKQYFRSWFILDFICAIPFSTIIEAYIVYDKYSSLNYWTRIEYIENKVVWLHLFKLIKILKFIKVCCKNYFRELVVELIIRMKFGKKLFIYFTILLFILILHIWSCLFIFIGYTSYPNWICKLELNYSQIIDVYFASFYWVSVSVFGIGYGDIVPNNFQERSFFVFLLIFGWLTYSLLVSTLSKQYEEFVSEVSWFSNEGYIEFNSNVAILKDIEEKYGKYVKDDTIFCRIHKYLCYKFEKEQFNHNAILDALPSGVKNNWLYEMHKPTIQNLIFFKRFNNMEFVIEVILKMKPSIASKNDRLVHEGDIIEEIIFIKNGSLVLEVPLSESITSKLKFYETELLKMKQQKRLLKEWNGEEKGQRRNISKYLKIVKLHKNEHFGDILMLLNKRSPWSVRVSTKLVEYFLLQKECWINILTKYKLIWKDWMETSLYNMNKIELWINKAKLFIESNQEHVKKLPESLVTSSHRASVNINPQRKRQVDNNKTVQALKTGLYDLSIWGNHGRSYDSDDSKGEGEGDEESSCITYNPNLNSSVINSESRACSEGVNWGTTIINHELQAHETIMMCNHYSFPRGSVNRIPWNSPPHRSNSLLNTTSPSSSRRRRPKKLKLFQAMSSTTSPNPRTKKRKTSNTPSERQRRSPLRKQNRSKMPPN